MTDRCRPRRESPRCVSLRRRIGALRSRSSRPTARRSWSARACRRPCGTGRDTWANSAKTNSRCPPGTGAPSGRSAARQPARPSRSRARACSCRRRRSGGRSRRIPAAACASRRWSACPCCRAREWMLCVVARARQCSLMLISVDYGLFLGLHSERSEESSPAHSEILHFVQNDRNSLIKV